MSYSSPDLPLSELTALTPLDGRYRQQTACLAAYLSEFSLIRVRVEVETAFLISLAKEKVIRPLTTQEKKMLEELGPAMTMTDVEEVKKTEARIKHDVKAVELYLRQKLSTTSLKDLTEYIHFGLTSEDINNLSYRLMLKRSFENVVLPTIAEVLTTLVSLSNTYKNLPMLARTHGQAAVPTTLGKEMVVFASRVNREYQKLRLFQFSGKLAGAVGNYNALAISYPEKDWMRFSEQFVQTLGLTHNSAVTQINTYEDVLEFFQILQRLNTILIDLAQDMWRYISDHWFIQEVKADEVGSSTMPQKVNPILFENSEGNFGMSSTMIDFFIRKLPVSRLQRDLTDSTVIRNFGVAVGYSFLGLTTLSRALTRVTPNTTAIEEALLSDWSILAEAVQTILRKHGVEDPYSLLKNLTRGEKISELGWQKIIHQLPVDNEVKKTLLTLSPKKYVGLAAAIVEKTVRDIKE